MEKEIFYLVKDITTGVIYNVVVSGKRINGDLIKINYKKRYVSGQITSELIPFGTLKEKTIAKQIKKEGNVVFLEVGIQ